MEDPKSHNESATLDDVLRLLNRLEQHTVSVEEFCTLYEAMWNFQVDKKCVSSAVFDLLDKLFSEVA